MIGSDSQTTSAWIPGPLLGLETSCDETSAAVLGGDGTVLANVIFSQDVVHQPFGGVVPELSSRAHIETIERVAGQAMREAGIQWAALKGLAVTRGPGLAGSLIVGVNYAKGLSYALHIPMVGINHLEGHIASAWLQDPTFQVPCIVLVVSGGHSHLYLKQTDGACALLGCTRDDAAGEAFDKGAQMLGLEYPGGPEIDRLAQTGSPTAIPFPRSYLTKGSLDFSFSGLKTALLYKLQQMDQRQREARVADLAAGYQEAIVTVLVDKAFSAVTSQSVSALAVVGGVSANTRLRILLQRQASASGIRLSLPPLSYCTDNAAMIAAAGRQALLSGRRAALDMEADACLVLQA